MVKQVLEQGDAVCFFPEGASRFHPTLAPLKSGGMTSLTFNRVFQANDFSISVAWLVSDILSKRKDNPDFTLNISLCSINYMYEIPSIFLRDV